MTVNVATSSYIAPRWSVAERISRPLDPGRSHCMASIYTHSTLTTVSLYRNPQASWCGHNAFFWSLLVSFHIISLNAFCPSLLAPLTLRILCRAQCQFQTLSQALSWCILDATYCMKFSSSLLDALIGGPCCALGFLLPPLMAQPPMKRVERVAIESYASAELAFVVACRRRNV